jgi:hypothetical protein
MAVALRFCPHFSTDPEAVVAYLYTGQDVGYELSEDNLAEGELYMEINPIDSDAEPLNREQVQEMARRDPLGLDSVTALAAS